MDAYISKEDFAKYMNPSTPSFTKGRIRSKFMKAIENKYTVLSYESFKIQASKASNIKEWIHDFTKDRMIVIDEVHNLLSSTYDAKAFAALESQPRLKKSSGLGTILFKALNIYAHASCKMIYLTATPVFDNIMQFKELVAVMSPEANIKRGADLKTTIDHLRGKVSFFPGTSANAYPKVVYNEVTVPLSKTQEKIFLEMDIEDEERKDDIEKNGDAFKIKQRTVCVACLPGFKKITASNMKTVISRLKEYSPKINELLHMIQKQRGKHVVYSTFVQNGVDVVEAALRSKGWISWKEAKASAEAAESHRGKVYAIWDGRVRDEEKLAIKAIVNSKDNMTGKNIRVIIGSPSIKEGVSFKHVQHLHLLDPVWNSSAKMQVEGRAVRFCSHVDIPKDHPWLKRQVVVHLYKSEATLFDTADVEIYEKIIPEKEKIIQAAENALKKVSIDYHLFKGLHEASDMSPNTPPGSAPSPVSVDEVVLRKKQGTKKEKTTCPKPRRPVNDTCPPGQFLRPNNRGDPCCYKTRGAANRRTGDGEAAKKPLLSSCPKPRRPDADGNCPEGMTAKENKHGVPCCYKSSKA